MVVENQRRDASVRRVGVLSHASMLVLGADFANSLTYLFFR